MTRINLVPPSSLHYKHLVAEYREISRVYALAKSWAERGKDTKIPPEYTLGKGHVAFFYDKLGFIRDRYQQLIDEMRRRGYTVNYPQLPDGLPKNLFGPYAPTEEAIRINRQRIDESLERMQSGETDEEVHRD